MSKLLKALDCEGKLIIINLDELKNNKNLEDSYVFKTLFGINENTEFGKFPMMKDENNNITLLKELDITSKQWCILMNFLRTGLTPYYLSYKNEFENKAEAYYNLEELSEISIKLGGINTVDKYYKEFYNINEDIKLKFYNPKNPEEDLLKKYNWLILENMSTVTYSNFINTHNESTGWSVASSFRPQGSVTTHIWWRKEKQNKCSYIQEYSND